MTDPWTWIDDELAAWEARGLRRRLAARAGPQWGSRFRHEGREYVNFGSNDYLGLAADEEISDAVRRTLPHIGWGAGASPLVTGRGEWHARLERELADFEQTEAALLFPTGYAANVGAITALVGPGDALFSDAKNHASIIDGCRLSGATIHVYRHADPNDLAEQLARHAPQARRRLIVTDGLFSMDGDFAPLADLVRLAEAHESMLLVDEAHATGVWGDRGGGASEACGVAARIGLRVGTLSKALGSQGGFAVGSRTLIDWLANRARPYIFSTAGPEALAVAACAALEVVHREPERRERLQSAAATLRDELRGRGWNIGASTSQIIPIVLGDADRTMRASALLRERGLWVPGIRPPSVPPGQSLLRISLTSGHTPDMIEQLLSALDTLAP